MAVVILGDSNVGKSNILLRFNEDRFDFDSKPTIGVELSNKKMTIDGKSIKVSIWDTAGQERYRAVTSTYYRNSSGIVLVYDITNHASFENIAYWLQEVKEHAPADALLVKMLIGNKIDLLYNRNVSEKEGADFAQANGMLFMETSAKDDSIKQKVEKAFRMLVEEIHAKSVAKKMDVASGSSSAGVLLGKNGQRIGGVGEPGSGESAKQSSCCGTK